MNKIPKRSFRVFIVLGLLSAILSFFFFCYCFAGGNYDPVSFVFGGAIGCFLIIFDDEIEFIRKYRKNLSASDDVSV